MGVVKFVRFVCRRAKSFSFLPEFALDRRLGSASPGDSPWHSATRSGGSGARNAMGADNGPTLLFCPTCRREFVAGRRICPMDGAELRPVPRETPTIGCVLDGRLAVTGHIGSGGMGTIFRALELTTREDLALKVLKPRFSQDREAVGQFYHEARAAGRLHDPHIVRIESFGRSSDGYLYIAMELLRGFPLAAHLAERDPLPAALAVHIARQVCAALKTAHRRGTVHRDLKPENIQLIPLADGEPVVKVLDFGIASVLSFDLERGLSDDTPVTGTPVYMSPEQIMGRPVDPRGDLYSLGVLLFEMLSGSPPFDADNALDICRQHLTQPPPDLMKAAPHGSVPGALAKLVQQLLEKNALRRPGGVGVVVRRLDAAADQLGPPPLLDPPPSAVCVDDALGPANHDPANHDPDDDDEPAASPPLVRQADGSLRPMPYRGGGRPVVVLATLPDDRRPTLVDELRPSDLADAAMTLRNALWLCSSCSCLNGRSDGPCESCGEEMRGPGVGIPVTPEDGPALPDGVTGPAWRSLSPVADDPEPSTALVRRPEQATPPPTDRIVAAPCRPATDELPRQRDEDRREVALLHVILAGDDPDGPLELDVLRELVEQRLLGWTRTLSVFGGMVSQDAGNEVRAVFGLLPERPPRWLERAVDAAAALRDTIAACSRGHERTVYVRGALAVGPVFLDPLELGDADTAVRGSSVDIATRLARGAPAGEVLLNAACWRHVASAFSGQACDTARSRGARHPELVYRLGERTRSWRAPRVRPASSVEDALEVTLL